MPQENMHCSRHSGTNDLPTRTAKKKKHFVEVICSGRSHKWAPLGHERSAHN